MHASSGSPEVRASRADFLHRASTRLVRDHDVIVIEDLAVKNMVRNRSLAKAISDCGWGTFRAMAEYKAARAGRHLIVIDRWYPSSKTCSSCGHLLAELSLKTRTWQCPSCGTRHDRDINAAKNVLAAGLAVAGGNPGDACGADVRPQGTPLGSAYQCLPARAGRDADHAHPRDVRRPAVPLAGLRGPVHLDGGRPGRRCLPPRTPRRLILHFLPALFMPQWALP